jgi:tetratricopeptide (TPR) repeat protein
MLALLSGDFAASARLGDETLRDGMRVQPDLAEQWSAVRRCILLRELGRGEELAAGVREIAARFPRLVTWRAVAALFDLDAGRLDAAREAVRELCAARLAAIERDTNWEISLAILGELCGGLGEGDAAAVVYEALLPHADRHVVIGLSIASYGSAQRYLGLLARARGDLAAAVAHLEEAVRSNDDAGARPWATHARLELAGALASLDPNRGRERSLELAARARRDAEALGMVVAAERARVRPRTRAGLVLHSRARSGPSGRG